ncbi:MAG: hypothetical protein DHS20C19_12990 [Acidimicrobiales bacterium]|nr:MAG: hypothetical protein DHS20C19_12990 [Acidimicrobiales bacterium]
MGLFSRKKREPVDDTVSDAADEQDPPAPESDPATGEARDAFEQLIDREWERLSSAGTWWTAGERVAIAVDARLAMAGEEPTGVLPPPLEEATARIAACPATIRGTDVARWELDGLDSFAYVETVGIVSRLMALDTAAFGLGIKARRLPEPQPGAPTRIRPDDAALTTGWSPTVGPASAPSSLTAVPDEAEAMFDFHGVLYATMEEMFDMQLEREGLTRPQIELVAARTSTLNECFY